MGAALALLVWLATPFAAKVELYSLKSDANGLRGKPDREGVGAYTAQCGSCPQALSHCPRLSVRWDDACIAVVDHDSRPP